MKLLFISTIHSVFMEPVRQAFERAGFDVRFVDYRGNRLLARDSITHSILAKMPASIRNRGYRYAQRQINKEIIHTAQEYQPDLIFAIKGKEVSHDTLSILRKIAPTANWYPETVDKWGGLVDTARHYQYFFAFDQLVIDKLKEEGLHNAYYLPFGADVTPDTTWPQEEAELKYNITFIGTYHPDRSDREHILTKVADQGLHIWGSKAWLDTSLRPYYRGTISNKDMLDVYRSSRIVINHYLTDVPGSGINLRPFEATGEGALLINHDVRSDIFKHFRQGEEFVSFSGENDIRDKVVYYMNNERERRQIAKNGFLRTQRDHTYDIRIAEILRIVGLSKK